MYAINRIAGTGNPLLRCRTVTISSPISPVIAVNHGAGRLEVFTTNAFHEVLHAAQTSVGGPWSAWFDRHRTAG